MKKAGPLPGGRLIYTYMLVHSGQIEAEGFEMSTWFSEKEIEAKQEAHRLNVIALPMNFILHGCRPELVRQPHVEMELRGELGDMGEMVTLLGYAVDPTVYVKHFYTPSTGDHGTSSVTFVRTWYYFHIEPLR